MFYNLVWGPLVIQLKYCPVLPSLNKDDDGDDDDDDDDDYYYKVNS